MLQNPAMHTNESQNWPKYSTVLGRRLSLYQVSIFKTRVCLHSYCFTCRHHLVLQIPASAFAKFGNNSIRVPQEIDVKVDVVDGLYIVSWSGVIRDAGKILTSRDM
jgi:hypothetical protein